MSQSLPPPTPDLPPPALRAGSLRWRLILPLMAIGGAVAIFIILNATAARIEPQGAAERVWPVSAQDWRRRDITPAVRLFGELVAARQVELRAPVGGEITDIWPVLTEGGIVAAGDKLAQIDPFEYKRALEESRARLREAEAMKAQTGAQIMQEEAVLAFAKTERDIARRDVARNADLFSGGHISQKIMDDKTLAALRQEENVESREGSLRVLAARSAQQDAVIEQRRLALARAERNFSDTLLSAPFSGYVGEVAAGLGKWVQPQDRLAVITDASSFEARFTIPDSLFGELTESGQRDLLGREVEILWRTGEYVLRYPAQIERLGARIVAGAGGVTAYAILRSDTLSTPLRPGAFVEINMPGRAYKNVAVLPEEALYENSAIYLVRDERLERVEVEVAGQTKGQVFLTERAGEEPVQDGALVLTTAFPQAGPGVRVWLTQGGRDGL